MPADSIAEDPPSGTTMANRSWARIKFWRVGMQLGGNNNYDGHLCDLPSPTASGQCVCDHGFDGSAFVVISSGNQAYFGKCASSQSNDAYIGVGAITECPITDPGREFAVGYSEPICPLPYRPSQNKECSTGKCGVVGSLSTYPGTGNKNLVETDYAAAAGTGLAFVRSYNSGVESIQQPIGSRWRHNYQRWIVRDSEDQVYGYRQDGTSIIFRRANSSAPWTTDGDRQERITDITSGSLIVGWQIQNSLDELETYDGYGRLTSIADRQGRTVTLTYSDEVNLEPGSRSAKLPIRVTDHFGRSISLLYDSVQRISVMTDPAGGTYRYTYGAGSKLVSVEYPDGKTRQRHYEDAANPNALTGITDENNQRFATWAYDAQGRTTLDELAGSVHRYSLTYGDLTATVTDPLNTVRTYNYSSVLSVRHLASIQGPVCPGCGPAAQTFDAHGNVASRTDWNGNRTSYTYDVARNLEATRTEGLTSGGGTTPQTRTISMEWDATFRLPTRIAEPLRITTNVYDDNGTQCGARGAVCSRTIQATTDANGSQGFSATPSGAPRTSTYTYNTSGQVLSANGARADVADVTAYSYDAQGNLATISNALGHLTSITSYNAHGQPLTIVDPNGVTTTLAYDARQRLTSRSVGGETTSYDYDGVGQLTKVTLPDGSFLSYSYDATHRLTGMQDNQGNRVAYVLDMMGNRTQEQVFDPASALAQTRSRVYSNLNRLFQELGAQNQTTEYAYDSQGNVTSVKDPLNRITANQYDALNRLKQVTDPASGVTQYAFNGLDALTQVTDSRSLVTGYTVDGLGNLTLQASPDTGNTANTYDVAGNLLTQTDAKGQVTSYAYDALNRVTLITFHDGSKQAYAYDQGANGIGRLGSITETNAANQQTSFIQYSYEPHGRVTAEARTVNGVQYTVAYTYDSAGRLSGITYPSGRTLAYTFDSLGRIGAISTTSNGQAQQVVSNVAYHPFGGAKSYTAWERPGLHARLRPGRAHQLLHARLEPVRHRLRRGEPHRVHQRHRQPRQQQHLRLRRPGPAHRRCNPRHALRL